MRLKSRYLLGEAGYLFMKESIQQCFCEDIILKNESTSFNHHGWYLLEYIYIPRQYLIVIEVEFNSYSVRIQEQEGEFVYLNQLVKFNNETKASDIMKMLKKLKKILEKSINFTLIK